MSEYTTDPGPGAAMAHGPDDQPIHQEFADPAQGIDAPSHRRGMLAGLAGVGVLLAVLVLVAPGGSKPALPPMVVHDVSPTASAPASASAAATTSTTVPAMTGTTSVTQPPPTPAIEASNQTHSSGTSVTPDTYRPATSAGGASIPTSAPTTTPTTAAPPPTTTPTTAPPTTTTTAPPPTTTTTSCLLGVLCP